MKVKEAPAGQKGFLSFEHILTVFCVHYHLQNCATPKMSGMELCPENMSHFLSSCVPVFSHRKRFLDLTVLYNFIYVYILLPPNTLLCAMSGSNKKRKVADDDGKVADGYGAASPIWHETSSESFNPLVKSMLTDVYQLTMAYGYWYNEKQDIPSAFDLFFRQNPFKGEFTIFAGLSEVTRFLTNFSFQEHDIAFLKSKYPDWKPGFWDWLRTLDTSKIKVYSIPEGSVCFPRIPLMRVEGPLAVAQLLETTLLVLVNFSSLVCTNAARHRIAVGPEKQLLEFGLRRAQGPDGALTASRYCIMGGFDSSSNVKAGQHFGIPISGTQAHSFVTTFSKLEDLKDSRVVGTDGKTHDLLAKALEYRTKLDKRTNDGELASFVAYARAYPNGFLALIDTYDTLESGVWNFIFVSLALDFLGFKPIGIRLDSGDLAYLSKKCRNVFKEVSTKFNVEFQKLKIVASNDLNEDILYALKDQRHEIDAFGIGTHLVTCKTQPALGCVYKLVEVDGIARIKISQDAGKVTIPGRKDVYRLMNKDGQPLLDLLAKAGEVPPIPNQKILCLCPFDRNKRVLVTPSRVVPLQQLVYDGQVMVKEDNLHQCKERVQNEMKFFREDHLRFMNPTPYKVSVTQALFEHMHDLWSQEAPVKEIS
eukprot:g58550.t1